MGGVQHPSNHSDVWFLHFSLSPPPFLNRQQYNRYYAKESFDLRQKSTTGQFGIRPHG
jgi:hypothetical protein